MEYVMKSYWPMSFWKKVLDITAVYLDALFMTQLTKTRAISSYVGRVNDIKVNGLARGLLGEGMAEETE